MTTQGELVDWNKTDTCCTSEVFSAQV